ncbi:MAG: hypothetical protein ACRDWI_20255 [Jiangellaceae bacterium]
MHGGSGDDQIFGDGRNNTLHGGTATILLFGDAGDDVLLGGPGYDHLANDGFDHCNRGPGGGHLYSCESRLWPHSRSQPCRTRHTFD